MPGSILQLRGLEGEWLASNAQKSLAYWRSLGQVAMSTNANIARCLFAQPQTAAEAAWLDATRKFYETPLAVSRETRQPEAPATAAR